MAVLTRVQQVCLCVCVSDIYVHEERLVVEAIWHFRVLTEPINVWIDGLCIIWTPIILKYKLRFKWKLVYNSRYKLWFVAICRLYGNTDLNCKMTDCLCACNLIMCVVIFETWVDNTFCARVLQLNWVFVFIVRKYYKVFFLNIVFMEDSPPVNSNILLVSRKHWM